MRGDALRGGGGGKSGSQILLHSNKELACDAFGLDEILRLIRIDDVLLMRDAIGDRVQDTLALIRSSNNVEGIERNDRTLERLLEISVSRKIPDPAAKRQ